MRQVRVEVPEAFGFLFEPARYKVPYGGRGSAKSWSVADALLIKGLEQKLRIGCFREIQNSIQESVHRLLSDRIEALGLSDFYTVTDRAITGANGTDFLFMGLFRNVHKVKSLEGLDIAWVEEAESVSKESWDLLIPTVRKEGSEIWVTFNPQYEEDDTYQRFVVNPPATAVTRMVNFDQNPYFPQTLRLEMEQDKARDFAKYETVWLGKPKGGGRKVWTGYDPAVHDRSIPWEVIAKQGNCFMAMDPHGHYYPFCVWIAIIPKNDRRQGPEDFHRHIYNEWPTVATLGGPYHELRKKLFYTGSMLDMAKAILAHDGIEHGINIRGRFMDTRFAKGSGGWNWSTQTEGTVIQFAKPENGGLLFALPPETRIDEQRQVIHDDMLWNKLVPRGPFNGPSFSIDPRCENTRRALLNHRLEKDKDKEDERYKDPSDALRIGWAGIAGRTWEDPAPKPAAATITRRVAIPSGWAA